MNKPLLCLILSVFCVKNACGQDNLSISNTNNNVPFSTLFYKLGDNTLHSFTYNCGTNYLLAGFSTYYLVHSGIDWKWSKMATENKALAFSGTPFGALGFILPVAMPLGLYFYGREHSRADLQITGLALGQAAMLGVVISSSIKVFTGRRDPHIMNGIVLGDRSDVDFSADFAFGFMNRNIFSGYPSSHTSVIFAMAVTLAELYPQNLWLQIASYSYATLTGIGMSLFAHWASDAVAGALVGYTIGKSVGASYRQLLDKHANNMSGINITKNFCLDVMPNYVTMSLRW